MVELVRYMAASLVDKPDKVDVREIENEEDIVIELRVDPDDMGKVIGKQGRIAKAIRTIVKGATPQGRQARLRGDHRVNRQTNPAGLCRRDFCVSPKLRGGDDCPGRRAYAGREAPAPSMPP